MTTLRQIEANRRNGRKSRGPKTAEGKLRSRHNARTHGLSISPMKDPSLTLEVRDLAENYIKCIGTAHSSAAVEMAVATITERRARAAGSPLWSRILTARHLEFDAAHQNTRQNQEDRSFWSPGKWSLPPCN